MLPLALSLQAESIPRPEYPQPQFEREQWLNLNGTWQFEFDDAKAGLAGHWELPSKKLSRTILVPFSFESPKSGIADPSFHPWIWYRRTFTIPQDWNAKRILLHFGAVFYRARVWVNDHEAGSHEGGNVPFVFDITGQLKRGENTVTVWSENLPTDRYIPRGKQYWEPKSHGIFYTRTSGIWQTVWLEPVGSSYLERVLVTPDAEGTAQIYAHVHDPKPGLRFRTTLTFATTSSSSLVAAEETRVSTVVSASNPHLWSPAHPNLYDVTFELLDGGTVVDRVKSYLGFRSITVENDRVNLNGNPIYLKLILDQGYWPESILTPPSDEAIQFDIRIAKEMGFNGARKHQKLEDPRWLYWADKMGFLVSSEMANAYLFDDSAVERFTTEWMGAVERDYNHPSIFVWVPINESWGVPNLRDPRQQNYLKELYALTHSFDRTRLVVDDDGWEHTDMTDLFNVHDYERSGERIAAKYSHLLEPGATVPDNGRRALAPGYRYNGTPVVLSEFGGIAFIPPGHQVPQEAWGYAGVEKTSESALDRLRGLYEGIAKTPGIAGFCYTQLTDVEQEINGLYTYDRKPKFPVEQIKAINDLVR